MRKRIYSEKIDEFEMGVILSFQKRAKKIFQNPDEYRFIFLSTIVLLTIVTSIFLINIQRSFAQTITLEPPKNQATQSAQTPEQLGSSVPRAHKKFSPADISEASRQEAEGTFINKCSSCHGEKGYGDGPWHTQFAPKPANLSLVRDTSTMFRSIVLNGVPGTMMPAFSSMDDQTLAGIRTYLSHQPSELSDQWEYPWILKDMAGKVTAEQGIGHYVTSCMGCHGSEGNGQSKFAEAPTVWPKPANFQARNSDVGRLYYIISHGREGTFMPPQDPSLPELTRWRLAKYVESLYKQDSQETIRTNKNPIPQIKNPYYLGDTATAGEGEDRYTLWCSPCHGDQGRGSFIAPRLIDRKWRYGSGTDLAVFTIVLEGVPGKLMPSWKKLPEDDRWKMITFIRSKGGLPEPLAIEQESRMGKTGESKQTRQGGPQR